MLVLASGHTLERTSTGEAQNTAVITLLVTPEDAEKVTLAASEGHIQLALRNPLDTRDAEVAAAWARGLYQRGAAPVAPVVRAPVHRVIDKAPPPRPSTGVSVEVYQGDKKSDVKLSDEGPGAK